MRFLVVILVTVLALSACGTSDSPAVAEVGSTAADDPATPATTSPTATTEDGAATETPVLTAEPATVEEAAPAAELADATGDGLFPVVVGATATTSDGTSWRVNVTLSSEYDSPDRYADAWRVLDADDNELGIRVLGHDHANEQPFTRSTNVDIPADLTTVFIEGRDQLNGWSGERYLLELDR